MVFKCHLKYDICTYQEFSDKLSMYKEYFQIKTTVDVAIQADNIPLQKKNCLFLQFQVQFDFKEMVICT